MRLIDADKLHDRVMKECNKYGKPMICFEDGCKILDIIEQQHIVDNDWIPVEERLPNTDDYILLSFSNFSIPLVGRYDEDEDGNGGFYIGDCDEEDTCISNDLYVNAWMPLPEPHREDE